MPNLNRDIDIGFPTDGVTHIADAKVDYKAGDLDTEAEVIAAINATNTKINLILDALEVYGIMQK